MIIKHFLMTKISFLLIGIYLKDKCAIRDKININSLTLIFKQLKIKNKD